MRILIPTLLLMANICWGNEGMWQPHQLPDMANQLKQLGLELDPQSLSSLDKFPMNTLVSLGGCSASFVSPKGLVVTNHHCVYGSIQYNSTPENNLLANGFLAKQLKEEVPAAPGSRIFITEEVTDVTSTVLKNVSETMSGLDRYQHIEKSIKDIIASCEKSEIHRCSVPAFHFGLQYFLIKQLEIRDVRLVYAPASDIGKYGGDIDNWQWPRHTGDFGFYRAYVDKQGKPAAFNEDNVPYQSKHYLKVSARSVEDGDFVMGLGYPGSTNRYRTANEVENTFTWYYPTSREIREDLMAIIHANSEPESKARISYEGTYASLANYAKNFQSMVESYSKSDFLTRKQNTESKLSAWIHSSEKRKQQYSESIDQLSNIINEYQLTKERDLILSYLRYISLPSAAAELYRLSQEKQKPDQEREPGYQARDFQLIEQYLTRITRRYDETIERSMLMYLLERYSLLPQSQRVASIDAFFEIEKGLNKKKTEKRLQRIYAKTNLNDEDVRLQWMEKTPEDFIKSKDPLIQYAVSSYEDSLAIEEKKKQLEGALQLWRSKYMEALIAYNKSIGQPIYADANSTLRVTYGQVKGNSPRDGLLNLPFTTLEGIIEKYTGEDPFNAPEQQLKLIQQKQYGKYKSASLGSVPVNFLNTLDITGGNSGSPTLNAKGELVGLLFDGVYESIIGDWDFNDQKNRAISVDSRYMLWVMEHLDNADNLLKEMDIVQ